MDSNSKATTLALYSLAIGLCIIHPTYQLSICQGNDLPNCNFKIEYVNDVCLCTHCSYVTSSCSDEGIGMSNFVKSYCNQWKQEGYCTDLFIPLVKTTTATILIKTKATKDVNYELPTTPEFSSQNIIGTMSTNSTVNGVTEMPSIYQNNIVISPLTLALVIAAALGFVVLAAGFAVSKIYKVHRNRRQSIGNSSERYEQISLPSLTQHVSIPNVTASIIDETASQSSHSNLDGLSDQDLIPSVPTLDEHEPQFDAGTADDTVSVNLNPRHPNADISLASRRRQELRDTPSDSKVESERLLQAEETDRAIRNPDVPQAPEVLPA